MHLCERRPQGAVRVSVKPLLLRQPKHRPVSLVLRSGVQIPADKREMLMVTKSALKTDLRKRNPSGANRGTPLQRRDVLQRFAGFGQRQVSSKCLVVEQLAHGNVSELLHQLEGVVDVEKH